MAGRWQMFLCAAGGLAGLAGLSVWVFGRLHRRVVGRCTSKASMEGKVVIITGASAGIGKETARDLARRGARVIMACRNLTKAERVAEEIRADTGNDLVEVQLLDTSSMASVRSFASEFLRKENRLDVLILNAGILGPSKLTLTQEGHEVTMATNHFGHFLLTNVLLDLLKKSSPSRIVVVSSFGHHYDKGFDVDDLDSKNRPYVGSALIYNSTKLSNILFANQLSQYLEGTEVVCNSLCPGLVKTEIFFKTTWDIIWTLFALVAHFSKTPEEGAQTVIHLAVSEEEAGTRGKFFIDCKPGVSSPLANDMGLAKKLWEKSEELVGLKPEERHY